MLSTSSPSEIFNRYGRFRDADLERQFCSATWSEERRALVAIAVVTGVLFVISVIGDAFLIGVDTSRFWVSASVRILVALATFGFAWTMFRRKQYAPHDFSTFCQECLIIASYLVIASNSPELAPYNMSVLAVMLLFIWYFAPLHPLYSLGSTALLIVGGLFLHFNFSPIDAGGLVVSFVLYGGVISLGFISVRNRDRLRREKFLEQRKLESANLELRKEIEIREIAESLEAQAKERFEGLFQAAPMPMALSQRGEGTLLAVNDAFASLIGRSRDDIVGKDHKDFVNIDDAYTELDRLLSEKTKSVSGELQVRREDGTNRECTVTCVRFDDPTSGTGQLLTGLYDITDRKEFERDLVSARLQAEKAQKVQSEFLATISHEIRTPLNALLGFLQVIELDDISDDVRSNLTLARQSGKHLLQLISDILDLSRLAAGKLELEPKDINCREICSDILETFQAIAKEKSVGLNSDVELSGATYRLDELRIRQVLFNLVGNAVKFTHEGEVKLRVREAGQSTGDHAWLHFEVIDTGIGIDPDKIDVIFQEFTQEDASVTREFGGSGLGLAISRKLIEAMDGRIGVKPNPAGGSIFWFDVPTCSSSANSIKPLSGERTSLSPKGHSDRATVLVAEDNPMNQRVICAFLKNLGVGYELVANGQEAIDCLCDRDFDLVLMDIQMPVLDGLSAIRFIRSGATLNADIPIVVVTANAMSGDRENYIRSGANEYLAKPVTLQDLTDVLSKFDLVAGDSAKETAAS